MIGARSFATAALLAACTERLPETPVETADAAPPGKNAQSCLGLPATCGGDQDCCRSTIVPGGTFFRSFDVVDHSDTSAPATVSTFRFETFEVTVGRFRAFVNAGQGTQANPPAAGSGAHPAIAGSGWSAAFNSALAVDRTALEAALHCSPLATWTDAPGANETLPMACLTWFEAMAFCAWDGGRLSTEAEWNYAASGGTEQRAFPWSIPASSTAIDPAIASFSCNGDRMTGCALADLATVGSLPGGIGRYGQLDLAGSVWEWTLDAFATYLVPCTDCAQLAGAQRVLRGGGYQSSTTALRTANRNNDVPTARFNDVGVRCVR